MDDAAYFAACDEHHDWLSGWATTHDYDPTWDYTVRFDQREHHLYRLAVTVFDRICQDAEHNDDIPFNRGRVYPADLNGSGAIFVAGTSAEPVVLIDLNAHAVLDVADQELAVADSVLHELRHAVQESLGLPFDEDEAEHGSARLPF